MIKTDSIKLGEIFAINSFENESKSVYITDGKFHEELTIDMAVDIITFLIQEFEIKVDENKS